MLMQNRLLQSCRASSFGYKYLLKIIGKKFQNDNGVSVVVRLNSIVDSAGIKRGKTFISMHMSDVQKS